MSVESMTTYADRLNLGGYAGDGAMTFARRAQTAQKGLAREKVLSTFSASNFRDGLSIMTMPSVTWEFERLLLNTRERGVRIERKPRRTHITAIERSRPLWTAALTTMPGLQHGLVLALPVPDYAVAAARSYAIPRFFLCTFEALAHGRDHPNPYDAAWIDLTGQLTLERVDALRALWERSIRSTLVVTSLKCRWPADMVAALAEHDGIAGLLEASLPGAVVRSEYVYADSVPMHQITLVRA